MNSIGPVAQQGIISTQVEHVVVETPPVVTQPAPPASPPPDSGRGVSVDVMA